MNMLLLILTGYLCGSIPAGKLIAAAHGIDIQQRGSGNIGFANVRRIVGWRAGIATLVFDILKGLAPTLIAYILINRDFAFWVGIAAVLGHVFPVWLRFRGGKGIATGLGLIAVLQPLGALIAFATYLLSVLFFKRSFIASLIGTLIVAIIGISTDHGHWWQYALLLAIASWTLRNNIRGTVPDYDT